MPAPTGTHTTRIEPHFCSSQSTLTPRRSAESVCTSYVFGFNGKENDNEVKGTGNSVDFGARIYDSRLGRWMSVDPLFKDYPDLSPYCFAANSPIMLVDRDGKKIYMSFDSQESIDAFLSVMQMGLEGQFDVGLKSVGNGQYEVVIGTNKDFPGNVDDMTPNGKAFYNVMSKIVTDKSVVNIKAVYGTSDVNVGKAATGEIDMKDIKQFNLTGKFNKVMVGSKSYSGYLKSRGFTQIGKLSHELYEQYKIQVERFDYDPAHSAAIKNAENPVNNNTREDEYENYSNGTVTQGATESDNSVTKMNYEADEPFEVKQSPSIPVITKEE
ncbi:MAG: RHS repeat-associated core domain-containing protein [Bacteroidales bacterium]|jgi:RHS repeat-associated protein|nr:RHS repeat-associated core domain-containing protein [Bacteroidales bacterium]